MIGIRICVCARISGVVCVCSSALVNERRDGGVAKEWRDGGREKGGETGVQQ